MMSTTCSKITTMRYRQLLHVAICESTSRKAFHSPSLPRTCSIEV